MSLKYPRYPLNVAGDFYVVDGWCIACGAPEREAPDLMANSSIPGLPIIEHCHFVKQPVTPDEIERACNAILVSCCQAVRYAGSDPAILDRLNRDPGCCDSVD